MADDGRLDREPYGLHWPGKAECVATIARPPRGVLRACRAESVNFELSRNLIVEGDNLEALKLLRASHLGKVKMIYIDPPYNTGHDFIFDDDYRESARTFRERTGRDADSDGTGRRHARWLSMMFPRLALARDLLAPDGILCVSIDDNELPNLRLVLDEVFGERNFISVIVVQSNKRGQTYKEISKTHEYLVIYAREPDVKLAELDKDQGALPHRDADGPFDLWELRNRNPRFGRRNRPNLFFPIYAAPGLRDDGQLAPVALQRSDDFSVEVWPRNRAGVDGCWRWSREKIEVERTTGGRPAVVARQRRDGEWNIYEKSRKSTTRAKSLWTETEMISEQGTTELRALGMAEWFDHPKPVALLKKCMRICAGKDATILDFFAGSGTTAQAVLELNAEDGGTRAFILVERPEPTRTRSPDGSWVETPAFRAGHMTIADIAKERVRRVIARLDAKDTDDAADEGTAAAVKADRGFRVYKVED